MQASISRRHFVTTVALGSAALLAGCSFETNSDTSKKETTAETPKLEGNLLVVGSTALQPLAEAGAEKFMAANPKVSINVQGGGSGQGLTQIAQGSVQVGNSDVFAEEKLKDKSQIGNLKDNRICVVGFAPVTHPGVGVPGVTMEQLQKIFTGAITNWKDLGGADQAIVVINRASGSGTRASFEGVVLKGVSVPAGFTPQEQDSSGTVLKMVKETPGAISYLALSYIDSSVVALKLDEVVPSEDTIAAGEWPIWSYEHMYTRTDVNDATKAYIDFMLSDEVQGELVEQLGYIPVKKMTVQKDASGKVSKN